MTASTCVHHPDRPAHALCMSCHRGVCLECATTWDGINYCATCLAEKRRTAKPRSSWIAAIPVALAAAGLFWAVTRLMVWSTVNTLDLFR